MRFFPMDVTAAGFQPRARLWVELPVVRAKPHFVMCHVGDPPACTLHIPWPIGHEPEDLARKVRAAPEYRAVYEAAWGWVRGEWRDAERFGSPLD